MLRAAAMLAGFTALWLAFTQRWNTDVDIAIAIGVGVVCVAVGARFGGLGRGGGSLAQAPVVVSMMVGRAGAVIRGALGVIRASIAADVTLKPALVRLKWRSPDDETQALFATLVSAAPGAVAVETEGDSLLMHVIDEDGVDADDLSRLEAQADLATGRSR